MQLSFHTINGCSIFINPIADPYYLPFAVIQLSAYTINDCTNFNIPIADSNHLPFAAL